MFRADCVVVRERCAVVAERLLGRLFCAQILIHLAFRLLAESEGEINASARLVGVADVASHPGMRAAFRDLSAKNIDGVFI